MCGDIFELAFVETYRLVSHSGRVLEHICIYRRFER